MRTKLDELQNSVLISAKQYDVIILSETWLHEEMKDAELSLTNYNIYRSDRNPLFASRGGGVLIAVSKYLQSKLVDITDSVNIAVDQIFVHVSFCNTDCIISAFYVPPSSDLSCYEEHICSLQECKLIFPNSHFIIVGDYNLPKSNWYLNGNICQFYPSNDIPSYILDNINFLVNSMNSLDLYQRNYFHNFYNNLLDLCFSNCDCNISLVLEEFISPDIAHPVLDISVLLPSLSFICDNNKPVHYDYYKLDFKTANYTVINAKLSDIDWFKELSSLTVVEATDKFYSIILTIIDKEVPKKHFKLTTFPNWFSSNLINLIFLKKE